jgi:hypothetical protein
MIAHLRDGVKPVLAALTPPVTIHLGWAYGDKTSEIPPMPYFVLAGPGWGSPEEAPVCGIDDALDAEFRLTAVAPNPESAGILLGRARAVLSPGSAWTVVPYEGRRVEVKFIRSEVLGVDPDVIIPATNRHPGYGVDTYWLVSEPH